MDNKYEVVYMPNDGNSAEHNHATLEAGDYVLVKRNAGKEGDVSVKPYEFYIDATDIESHPEAERNKYIKQLIKQKEPEIDKYINEYGDANNIFSFSTTKANGMINPGKEFGRGVSETANFVSDLAEGVFNIGVATIGTMLDPTSYQHKEGVSELSNFLSNVQSKRKHLAEKEDEIIGRVPTVIPNLALQDDDYAGHFAHFMGSLVSVPGLQVMPKVVKAAELTRAGAPFLKTASAFLKGVATSPEVMFTASSGISDNAKSTEDLANLLTGATQLAKQTINIKNIARKNKEVRKLKKSLRKIAHGKPLTKDDALRFKATGFLTASMTDEELDNAVSEYNRLAGEYTQKARTGLGELSKLSGDSESALGQNSSLLKSMAEGEEAFSHQAKALSNQMYDQVSKQGKDYFSKAYDGLNARAGEQSNAINQIIVTELFNKNLKTPVPTSVIENLFKKEGEIKMFALMPLTEKLARVTEALGLEVDNSKTSFNKNMAKTIEEAISKKLKATFPDLMGDLEKTGQEYRAWQNFLGKSKVEGGAKSGNTMAKITQGTNIDPIKMDDAVSQAEEMFHSSQSALEHTPHFMEEIIHQKIPEIYIASKLAKKDITARSILDLEQSLDKQGLLPSYKKEISDFAFEKLGIGAFTSNEEKNMLEFNEKKYGEWLKTNPSTLDKQRLDKVKDLVKVADLQIREAENLSQEERGFIRKIVFKLGQGVFRAETFNRTGKFSLIDSVLGVVSSIPVIRNIGKLDFKTVLKILNNLQDVDTHEVMELLKDSNPNLLKKLSLAIKTNSETDEAKFLDYYSRWTQSTQGLNAIKNTFELED